jgi:hypothetical protein
VTPQAVYKITVLTVVVITLHQKSHIHRNKPSAIQEAHYMPLNLQRAIKINTDFFADKQKYAYSDSSVHALK